MIGSISRWVHLRRGHAITQTRVSVPMWDIHARGMLYHCSCTKVWAE